MITEADSSFQTIQISIHSLAGKWFVASAVNKQKTRWFIVKYNDGKQIDASATSMILPSVISSVMLMKIYLLLNGV